MRRAQQLLAAVFVLALALPGLALFGTGLRTLLELENRPAAPWPLPGALLASPREFTLAFERAFADRFGGRDALVRLHHLINVAVFGVSPVSQVMLGRDGWLYFLGERGTEFDQHYLGRSPQPDASIEALADELARRQAGLAARGITYLVVAAPDKQSIYPEHLPAWPKRAERTPLDRLAGALESRRVRFVDLRRDLTAEKEGARLYFAADSHWTLPGVIVGYRAIMRALEPGIVAAPPPAPPYVPGPAQWSGDLARMLGLPERYLEPYYAETWRRLADPSRCARHMGNEVYVCDRARPRAVVLRDSMGTALVPLLAENFARTVVVPSYRLDSALIDRERPDVVIQQFVERAMFQLSAPEK